MTTEPNKSPPLPELRRITRRERILRKLKYLVVNCPDCEDLKQFGREIDDEPCNFQVQSCFTYGTSRIVPDPGLVGRLAYYAHEPSAPLRDLIAKARGQA